MSRRAVGDFKSLFTQLLGKFGTGIALFYFEGNVKYLLAARFYDLSLGIPFFNKNQRILLIGRIHIATFQAVSLQIRMGFSFTSSIMCQAGYLLIKSFRSFDIAYIEGSLGNCRKHTGAESGIILRFVAMLFAG